MDTEANSMLRAVTTSVVIPALNEAENLPYVLPKIPDWVHEVILVDDHCTDDTVDVARSLRPSIRIVKNTRPPGKGNALQTGFDAATGDIVAAVDADGSEDPRELTSYVGVLLAGADYAKGTRFIQGGGTSDMPAFRRWGNTVFVHLVHLLFGGNYSDLCYGYNAMWRRIVPLLKLDGDGFEIETMMNIRALQLGLHIAEVPSFEAERVHGTGRLLTFPDGWRVFRTIFREWLSPIISSNQPASVKHRVNVQQAMVLAALATAGGSAVAGFVSAHTHRRRLERYRARVNLRTIKR